jgi:arylformamidase
MSGNGERQWLDISVPLDERTTVFPDTPAVDLERVSSLSEDDPANVTAMACSTHSGTHIDAPVHFLEGAGGVEEVDLDSLNGPARVLDFTDRSRIGRPELEALDPSPAERLILQTRNSSHHSPPWYLRQFDPDYAHLGSDAAELLAERKISLVGIDYLSIGGEGRDNPETHRVLLGAGVTILEGLALEEVEPGTYELRCLPLLMPGADGAPARAALTPLGA